jgi:stearoyl-CoA desaturase (delta-9 desaturase)
MILASNTAILPYAQILFTAATIAFAILGSSTGWMWAFSVLMYVLIGCFGISIGYHRLLTHKSFKTSKFWERFCTIWGALAFTGSSIGWVGVHRQHHAYSDHEGDPHSPTVHGAKMLIANYKFDANKWSVRYLITSKFHVFLHKYYFGLLGLWTAIWAAFGIAALMHVVIIPAVISIWVSTLSNYMNHKWGYENYATRDDSKNLWLNAIFTFGEGWHNNHHARPGDWNFGHKWWEIDLGAQIIKLIKT